MNDEHLRLCGSDEWAVMLEKRRREAGSRQHMWLGVRPPPSLCRDATLAGLA